MAKLAIYFLSFLVVCQVAFARSPKFVVVNGTKWTIVYHKDIIVQNRPYDGYTSCDEHIIRIANDIGRCFEAVTLFHELEHASVCNEGFELQNMTGHAAIDRLAFGMPKIIADNPKLRHYFGQARNCSWNAAE